MQSQPSDLRAEARAFAELKARIAEAYKLDENDEAVLDTVEGQSVLSDLILIAIREVRRREAMADAMGQIIIDNKERCARHERAAAAIRAAVASAMQEAGLRKVEGADLTITTREIAPKPMIVDETQLPEWAKEYKAVPNRAAIKAVFEQSSGRFECPGVAIANGGISITVRSK